SANHIAEQYANDVLASLTPNALLIMHGDVNYGTVSYAQVVEHRRPDVIALDAELLKSASYVAEARRRHPGLVIPFAAYDGGRTVSLNKLVAANLPKRPVYYIGGKPEAQFGKPFFQLHEGLVWRLVPKGTATDRYAAIRRNPRFFERLQYPAKTYSPTSWESVIATGYGSTAFDIAYGLDDSKASDVPAAERMYRIAIRLDPTPAAAYNDLGLLLYPNH